MKLLNKRLKLLNLEYPDGSIPMKTPPEIEDLNNNFTTDLPLPNYKPDTREKIILFASEVPQLEPLNKDLLIKDYDQTPIIKHKNSTSNKSLNHIDKNDSKGNMYWVSKSFLNYHNSLYLNYNKFQVFKSSELLFSMQNV